MTTDNLTEEEKRKRFERMMDSFPSASRLSVFNNDQYYGFFVSWSESKMGFGEFTLSCNKATGEWTCDRECMSDEWIANMLMRLVGTTVNSFAIPGKKGASGETETE